MGESKNKAWAYAIIGLQPDSVARALGSKIERHCSPMPGVTFVASKLTATELTKALRGRAKTFLILDTGTDRGGMLPTPFWDFLSTYDAKEPAAEP